MYEENEVPTESNHPVLQQLKDNIANLEQQVKVQQSLRQTFSDRLGEYQVKIGYQKDNVKNILLEMYEDDRISKEDGERLAEALEIEVVKYLDVQGTISFSGKIQVSVFDDVDNLHTWDFGSQLSVSYDGTGEDLEDLDYDIEDVDIS
jgi:hypothetical protein